MIEQPRGDEIDTVVLACTHVPLLTDELSAAMPGISCVDGGPGIARRLAWLTKDQVLNTRSWAEIEKGKP